MKRNVIIKQTASYLNRYEPYLHIGWLEKLNDSQLLELYHLLSDIEDVEDLIRF